ncbi:hypothetical protein MHU86_9185 [Fragilaria crotonensis]|nr:hypothetical protein MHU86_9185 [Fragilaria crotonensis]
MTNRSANFTRGYSSTKSIPLIIQRSKRLRRSWRITKRWLWLQGNLKEPNAQLNFQGTVVAREPKNAKQFFEQLQQNENRQRTVPNDRETSKIVDKFAGDPPIRSKHGVVKRLYEEDSSEEPDDPLPDEGDRFKPLASYQETLTNNKVILDVRDIVDQADEDFVESLFVEMCFFARLGFLQPPMCLRCLYMESVEGMEEDSDCRHFCVWRRNANDALHPNTMAGNLCLVECQAARRLIEGNEVQQHYWDHIKRRLVMVER